MKNYQIHNTTLLGENVIIGKGTKIWQFSNIMSDSIIGENCNIGQNVVISPFVKLGNNVKIQNNVSVYTGVICEDDVFLGPSMVFTNVLNPRSHINRRDQYIKTLIRKGSTIGANATILCGNTIEKYSLVGAGAVLTKSTLPYSIFVGNPAIQIGWISEYGNRLNFDNNNIATCKDTNDKYLLESNKVKKI